MTKQRFDFTNLNSQSNGKVLCIAHRGASAYAQENSAVALQKAADLGADMVELDIRITADDHPVVAHDDSLKRLYNLPHAISDLTLRELKARFNQTEIPILTFEEVALTCAALRLGMYLDIKTLSSNSSAILFDVLTSFGLIDYSIFGSFRPDWLAEIKANHPQSRTSILFSSTHVDAVKLASSINANYVHPCWENAAPRPHELLTPHWLESVQNEGLGVITWHEERVSEIKALVQMGVSGICSDTPDRVHNIIRSQAKTP